MKTNNEPSEETLNQWHSDPSNWKWGIFYFNKNDKRLFPPKRVKAFGWTINFANPASILAMVVITVALLVLFGAIAKL